MSAEGRKPALGGETTIRLSRDVDGCGCIRCQQVGYGHLSASLSDALIWSARLPIVRPSIVLVFAVLSFCQLGVIVVPAGGMAASVLLGLVGAFIVRGYIAVIGRGILGDQEVSATRALALVGRRLPACLGAFVAVGAVLGTVVSLSTHVLAEPARTVMGFAGAPPGIADIGLLIALSGVLLGTLIKLCFVPEACFVGGYGPLRSLRVSWHLTSVRPRKAAAITLGLAALLAIGAALDTQLADPKSPVVLSFRYGEQMIPLRSFGISRAVGMRAGVDLVTTTAYSGVFVHQYVSAIFD